MVSEEGETIEVNIYQTEDDLGYMEFHSFDIVDQLDFGKNDVYAQILDEDGMIGTVEIEITLYE